MRRDRLTTIRSAGWGAARHSIPPDHRGEEDRGEPEAVVRRRPRALPQGQVARQPDATRRRFAGGPAGGYNPAIFTVGSILACLESPVTPGPCAPVGGVRGLTGPRRERVVIPG